MEGSLGGFSLWCDTLKDNITIQNPICMDGKVNEYMKKQWFSNVAFFSPVLTGSSPTTHNTTVEVSFKVKKHHEDLGILARQRSGGMDVQEYVKRAGEEAKAEAVRVYAIGMELLSRKPREKKKRETHPSAGAKGGRKKKKTMSQRVTEVNPLNANGSLVDAVFQPKVKTKASITTKAGSGQDINDSAGHRRFDVPATQQSQAEVHLAEEGWQKRRPLGKEDEIKNFVTSFQTLIQDTFQGWTNKNIANFFTREALLPVDGSSLHDSAVSRIRTKGVPPGKKVRELLRKFWDQKLPFYTVDNTEKMVSFSLLPSAEKRVKELLGGKNVVNAAMTKREDSKVLCGKDIVRSYGDTEMEFQDFRQLVVVSSSFVSMSQHWVSDNVINLMTNLFSGIPTSRKVFFFNCLTIEAAMELKLSYGTGSGLTENERDERLRRISEKQLLMRAGQSATFLEADVSFAPCLVNGNHWIGFRIRKDNHTIQAVNSMSSSPEDGARGEALASFVLLLDNEEWSYLGGDAKFPRQKNSMDCGILVLIAARCWARGEEIHEDVNTEEVTRKWRVRVAHEMIVGKASYNLF